jgi:S1-C subfamily serine protease
MSFGRRLALLLGTFLLVIAALFGEPVMYTIFGNDRIGKLPVGRDLTHDARNALVRRAVRSTVTVHVHPYLPRGGLAEGFGTGAFIDADGLILTAAHVVDAHELVYVTLRRLDSTASGYDELRAEPADVLAVDAGRDLAILRIRHPDRVRFTPLKVCAENVMRKDAWYWFIGTRTAPGMAIVTDPSYRAELYGGGPLEPPTIVTEAVETRAYALQGDSGGPTLDHNVCIVGIMIGSNQMDTGIVSPLRNGYRELLVRARTKVALPLTDP